MDRPAWGQLPEYYIKKASWFAQQGLPQEALHVMWVMVTDNAEYGRKLDQTTGKERSVHLATRWLRGVNWEGPDVLDGKVQMAASMLAEMQALASDLS